MTDQTPEQKAEAERQAKAAENARITKEAHEQAAMHRAAVGPEENPVIAVSKSLAERIKNGDIQKGTITRAP